MGLFIAWVEWEVQCTDNAHIELFFHSMKTETILRLLLGRVPLK